MEFIKQEKSEFLAIDYIVSWDTSKIGDMECSIYKKKQNVIIAFEDESTFESTPMEGGGHFLLRGNYCNAEKVTSTGVCTYFPLLGLDVNGWYSLTCKKLDDRLVGFAGLTLSKFTKVA